MQIILILQIVFISLFAGNIAQAESSGESYLPTDNRFRCEPTNESLQPWNTFLFSMFVEAEAVTKKGYEIFSDENLQSGNREIVYEVRIFQKHAKNTRDKALVSILPGCERSLFFLRPREDGTKNQNLYVECDADGDAGYMNFIVKFNSQDPDFAFYGDIHFPEGQSTLPRPISDGTSINVRCVPD